MKATWIFNPVLCYLGPYRRYKFEWVTKEKHKNNQVTKKNGNTDLSDTGRHPAISLTAVWNQFIIADWKLTPMVPYVKHIIKNINGCRRKGIRGIFEYFRKNTTWLRTLKIRDQVGSLQENCNFSYSSSFGISR